MDRRKTIEKESLFTKHLGVGSSHTSLATDKTSKLHQLKSLAYKSTLAKASTALNSESKSKPLLGLVKLKRKASGTFQSNSEETASIPAETSGDNSLSRVVIQPNSPVVDHKLVETKPTSSQTICDKEHSIGSKANCGKDPVEADSFGSQANGHEFNGGNSSEVTSTVTNSLNSLCRYSNSSSDSD